MKKAIAIILLIILIPYLTVNFFITDEEIKFHFTSNMVVRVKREKTNVIDKIYFEDYVIGVLAGEMPASFELEALKAQAVAARSYVMRRMESNETKDYDVVDTVMNQVYLDEENLRNKWKTKYDEYYNKIKTAVFETKGEYLEYDGKIADAMFFSTSTGNTENSEEIFISALPYLRSVASVWDSEVSPVFEEKYVFKIKDFFNMLNLTYSDKIDVSVVKATSTGRIKKIKINEKTFDGNELAAKLQIRSNYFDIKQTGSTINITTKGYGHGVGMSQYGALGMAKEGYTYDKILLHYYQGVEIKKI